MPPIWKGSLTFGLVNIPVALAAAESPDDLSFDLLDKRDLAHIGYETINKSTGRKVARKDIVKGYEIAKGQYVTVSDEDFRQANVKATQTLEILEFVERDAIDARFFERPYFLTPLPRAERAYVLLCEALRARERVAVARLVLRTREHLAAVFPLDGVLICNLMRFAHELRAAPKIAKIAKPGDKEMTMARALIDSMSGDWRPETLHDRYRDDLLKLLRRKRTHPGEAPPATPPVEKPSNVVDLISLLRESLEAGAARPASVRRRAARAGAVKAPRARRTVASRSRRNRSAS